MIENIDIEELELSPIQKESAKRFAKDNENLTIDKLKSDFHRWNTYVPSNVDIRRMNYRQFLNTILLYGVKGIAPHPLYDDGNLTISEFYSWEECENFPVENSFCICNKETQIGKYRNNGYRVFIMCDRSKLLTDDNTRIMGFICKNNQLSFWDANDILCKGDINPIIQSLPIKAQNVIKGLGEINESINMNTKTHDVQYGKKVYHINESRLRDMIAESIDRVLHEAYRVGEFDYPQDFNTEYKSIRLSKNEFERVDNVFHIIGNKSYMIKRRSSGEVDLYAMNGERIDKIRRYLRTGTLYEHKTHSSFADHFNYSRNYHKENGRRYGFELRKDGEWEYGDIEYDPNNKTMSCLGISIRVRPEMSLLDAEEDLFEALINAGFDTDF